MQQNYYNGYNPYLAGATRLGQDDGDVSLVGPVVLLLGLIGIGAAIIIMKDRGRNDNYDYDRREEPAVTRLRNVISDIESDDLDSDDDDGFDDDESDDEDDDFLE